MNEEPSIAEQIHNLSIQLGEMKIFQASLEMDYRDYMEINEAVAKEYNIADIIYQNKEDGKTPGFTLSLNSVKMYFNCRNVFF